MRFSPPRHGCSSQAEISHQRRPAGRRRGRRDGFAIILLALALVLPARSAHPQQTTVTRDRFGREVFTTTRTRDSVVVRDRFGREVLTTRKDQLEKGK